MWDSLIKRSKRSDHIMNLQKNLISTGLRPDLGENDI